MSKIISKSSNIFLTAQQPGRTSSSTWKRTVTSAKLIVHWRDHTLTAKDTNADMYMALTRAIAKIEKQALKLKKKIIDRKQGARTNCGRGAEPDGQSGSQPASAADYHRAPLCN